MSASGDFAEQSGLLAPVRYIFATPAAEYRL
jgi:hypothetical protein